MHTSHVSDTLEADRPADRPTRLVGRTPITVSMPAFHFDDEITAETQYPPPTFIIEVAAVIRRRSFELRPDLRTTQSKTGVCVCVCVHDN